VPKRDAAEVAHIHAGQAVELRVLKVDPGLPAVRGGLPSVNGRLSSIRRGLSSVGRCSLTIRRGPGSVGGRVPTISVPRSHESSNRRGLSALGGQDGFLLAPGRLVASFSDEVA